MSKFAFYHNVFNSMLKLYLGLKKMSVFYLLHTRCIIQTKRRLVQKLLHNWTPIVPNSHDKISIWLSLIIIFNTYVLHLDSFQLTLSNMQSRFEAFAAANFLCLYYFIIITFMYKARIDVILFIFDVNGFGKDYLFRTCLIDNMFSSQKRLYQIV